MEHPLREPLELRQSCSRTSSFTWLQVDDPVGPGVPDDLNFPQKPAVCAWPRATELRTGKNPWDGRYLIHDAVQRIIDPIPMLDALAEAGADLSVRLNGRTLLHMAALDGEP